MLCSSRRRTRHLAVATAAAIVATSNRSATVKATTANYKPNSYGGCIIKIWQCPPTLLLVAFVIAMSQPSCVRCDGRKVQRSADQWIKLNPSDGGNGTSVTTTAQPLFSTYTESNIDVVTVKPSPSSSSTKPPIATSGLSFTARPPNLNASVIVPHPGQPMAMQPLFVSDMGQPSSVNALPHPSVTRRPPQSGHSSSTSISAGVSTTPSHSPSKSIKHPSPTDSTRMATKKMNQTENNKSKSATNGNVHQRSSFQTNLTTSSINTNISVSSTHLNNSSLTVPLADTMDDNNGTINDPLHKISMNAWSWHYHVFGIAFCLLAILSSYSLLHFVLCLSVVQRLYFFLSNVCLCMFCICRCCYVLQADAYRHIALSYAVAVYDSSTFLVTLAVMLLFGGACTFSEVQWWIFRPIRPLAVNSFVVPYSLVTSSLLVVIAVVGSMWPATEGPTIYYMILVQKVVSVLWSLSFILLCWLLYGRLYKDSQRKQSQILRTELTKLHIEGTQLPRNIPKPCLCLCVRSLCVTSCLLLIHNALIVYGLVYSEDMVLSLLLGKTGSPSWWIYQNVTCVFEVGMCACLACGHCWSHCGHQCRSVLGKRFANWDFRRDVWQTSTQHLRRLSERGFRRRHGGSGIDNRCRTVGGVDIGEDYDVIERLAGGGGERDTEFPSSFFGIYGNGNSVPGGRGVSSSTHFTFERWERSYNNGGKAVATNTSCLDASDPADHHPSVSIANDITTRHPQHSHHYFHTATVRPVLKTFQRLSQVSPQRLQAQLKSSTLALQRKGRNVSSAVVSSLRSLTTSRRSSSSSSSSGNVAATAFGVNGQHGLSVTPIKFSTSPRICSMLGGNKADYVNVPNSALPTHCGSQKHPVSSHQKHSHHNQHNNIQDISEGVGGLVAIRDSNIQDHHRIHHSVRKEILQATSSAPPVPAHKGHTWFNFQQPSRKRYLNKRLLEKSAKRKSRHANKDSCSGQESIDVIPDSIPSVTSIGHQQNYPCIATSTTSSSAFTNAAASCRQKFMDKRKSQRGTEKSKGKVKDFANKVLMVSRATQVYIPSPCKGSATIASITQNNCLDQQHQHCMQPKTQSRHHITSGESSLTNRRYKSGKSYFLPEIKTPVRRCRGDNDVEEEEGNDEEFEYEDDQDLISAVNKYSRSNSYHHRSHSTNTLSPYHGSQGALALASGTQLKRSWHVANSSTSCSSESAANSFDVRFYVYSPSPGEVSPNGSMSSPSRDFHDHFYPKLYHHHHHHPRHHHRPHHNGSVKNIFSSHVSHRVADTTQLPDSGHCEDKVLLESCRYNRFLSGAGSDPYATVDRSGAGDIINCTKANFLPRLVSNSLLDSSAPRTAAMTSAQHHFRTATDVSTGSGHHYAATQLIAPRDMLEVRCRGGGSSVSGSSGSSRPPSGASGQSEKQNSMYLSEDDDNNRAGVDTKDLYCSSIGQHQQHPNNLNLSLPLERDVYYPTVVKIKNPQDITPDSAVYLELNSPQTVDTPPTIREHPRRFPPFPCASTKNGAHSGAGLGRMIASNETGAIALRKSASFGNLLQFNKTHHHHHPHHHHYQDEQRQQVVLQTLDSRGRSITSMTAKRGAVATEFPAPKLRSSLSMERLPSNCCAGAADGGASNGRRDETRASDGECCGHQVRWRRWLSANELEPNSDSVYDSRDSVSFPSHDVDDEELVHDGLDITSGTTSAACAPLQRASQIQVKTAGSSNCV